MLWAASSSTTTNVHTAQKKRSGGNFLVAQQVLVLHMLLNPHGELESCGISPFWAMLGHLLLNFYYRAWFLFRRVVLPWGEMYTKNGFNCVSQDACFYVQIKTNRHHSYISSLPARRCTLDQVQNAWYLFQHVKWKWTHISHNWGFPEEQECPCEPYSGDGGIKRVHTRARLSSHFHLNPCG